VEYPLLLELVVDVGSIPTSQSEVHWLVVACCKL
jgi:hypothetical protein